MEPVKLAIVYYSATGMVHAMARRLEEAAAAAGAEVRLRQVSELAPDGVIQSNQAWVTHRSETSYVEIARPDDVVWADAVLFGTPTRFGNVSSQLKQFLDTLGPVWAKGLLADKAYAGFTATQTAHGGHESTLLALYNTIYHFGGVIVPPGYTDSLKFADGNPYGVSHATGPANDVPLGVAQLAALDHLATRLVEVASRTGKRTVVSA